MSSWDLIKTLLPKGLALLTQRQEIMLLIEDVQPAFEHLQKAWAVASPHISDAWSVVQPRWGDIVARSRRIMSVVFPALKSPAQGGGGGKYVVAFTIEWVQISINRLIDAGVISGPKIEVDGLLGPETKEAVARYQQRNVDIQRPGWVQLDVDEVPGLKTCFAIWDDLEGGNHGSRP